MPYNDPDRLAGEAGILSARSQIPACLRRRAKYGGQEARDDKIPHTAGGRSILISNAT